MRPICRLAFLTALRQAHSATLNIVASSAKKAKLEDAALRHPRTVQKTSKVRMTNPDQSWSPRALLSTSKIAAKAQVQWPRTTCRWSLTNLSKIKFQDLTQPTNEQAKDNINQILFNPTSARRRIWKCHSIHPSVVRQISRRHRQLRSVTTRTIIKNKRITPCTECKTSSTAMLTLTTVWMMVQNKASLKSRVALTSIIREDELRLKFFTARRIQEDKCNQP